MGSDYSSPGGSKSVNITESEKSARNVLENIGRNIKDRASQDEIKYSNALKGNLKAAKFHHPYSQYRRYYTGTCDLDYRFHSNIWSGDNAYRHPCAGRNNNRFSNESEAECNSSKITGNEGTTGACAPYRRRHLCDYVLHQINPNHINNSDDLLGNLLVTAKYEGESIVNSYANSGTLNVCIGLARSFADIGDIIRGKDLYIGNGDYKEKVSNNLKKIFKKIYKQLIDKYKETDTLYKDEEGNYLKLREAWWNANRDQIWKAITCAAGGNEVYSKNIGNSTTTVSEGKCREVQGHPSTNLDYVPQFLRWFNEWSEDFCRVREHKLKKVKDTCQGYNDSGYRIYCSGDGHDCTKTDLSRNSIYVDLDCPDCEKECRKYNEWIENQEKEFNKQKNKYTKEIKKLKDNSNNNYDKNFYQTLAEKYGSINLFLDALKEGSHCRYNAEEDEIDFNKADETFTISKYCGACPFYGVTCNKEKCTHVKEDDYKRNKKFDSKDTKGESTAIEVLVTHNRGTDIVEDLKDCKNYSLFKGIRNQKWKCAYENEIDACKVDNFVKHIDVDERISFKVLFERWLRNFIKDYNNVKDKINRCVKNEDAKDKICIKKCKEHCDCVEKWINKKDGEWREIKKYYNAQAKSNKESIVHRVKRFFEQGSFEIDYKKAQEVVKGSEEQKKLWGCTDRDDRIAEETKSDKDFITNLISELQKKINSCKKQNEGTQENCCKTIPEITDDDEDDEDQEQVSSTPCGTGESSSTNPCANKSSAKPNKTLNVMATEIQDEAHKKMVENSGTDGTGESKLKGDISRAIFYNGRQVIYFKGKQICDITIKNSNAQGKNRAYNYAGPCRGKNQGRFNIGTEWSYKDNNKKKTHPEVYMPPRREHMCTSNLENLYLKSKGLSNGSFASHSLLGNVLLAAKYEAENIKKRYQQNEGKKGLNDKKDQETVCRAIRYSFADLGDIIRGRDMWDKEKDMQKLQGHLQKVFNTVRQNLPKEIQNKYKGDNDGKHTQLRSDWWEANRHQVWKAMKCAKIGGDCSGVTPYDDYIPQRLRWMTEWAEWYCKAQSQEYKKLEDACSKCKDNGQNCTKGNGNICTNCTQACTEYKNKIEKWANQWTKIKDKYDELYKKSLENGATVASGGTKVTTISNEDEHVVDFLRKLHDGNKDKSNIYSSAAGYIHETAYINDCKIQTDFCEKKNGGKDDNVKYTFKEKPQDYVTACGCKKAPDQTYACTIATNLVKNNNGKAKINGCGSKTEGRYPGWDCTNNYVKTEHNGACIPPRRQKLCTSDLTQDRSLTKKEDILTKFINCAAKETHFAWHKYKEINTGADKELQGGNIPEGFKRQMYYTFGDYRDIFFGTDISKYSHISGVSSKVNDILQKDSKEKEKPEDWWNERGKDIWKGMLCALTNDVKETNKKTEIKTKYSYEELNKPPNGTNKLEDFAKKYQFLRWYIEWSDEFCTERKKLEDKVSGDCTSDYEGCKGQYENRNGCVKACEEYKKYITDKENEYTKQKGKFDADKKQNKPEYNDISTKDPPEYLKDKCLFASCNCMEKLKEIEYYWKNSKKTYEVSQLENRCECELPPPVADTTTPLDICKIVAEALKVNKLQEACSQKYSHGKEKYTQWKCNSDISSKSSDKHDGGSVCIPPRRQKMYVAPLQNAEVTTEVELRKAFIESAAVETFFQWHKYKKEKEKKKSENGAAGSELLRNSLFGDISTQEEKPEDELKKGTIPEEFKRQMFYTLADYRDICIGKTPNGIDTVSAGVGGKDKDIKGEKKSKMTMKEISDKIEEHIKSLSQQSGTEATSGTPHTQQPQNPTQLRENWWENNAESIWKGMICALTYEEKTSGAKPIAGASGITQNEGLKDAFFGKENTDGKLKDTQYEYKNVKLDNSDDTNPLSGSFPSGEKTTHLSKFVLRPPFFRYLEEWGEEFCKKRTDKLKQIKVECRGKNGNSKVCSGYGEDCKDQLPEDPSTFPSFKCPGCGKHCSSYRKWIGKKKTEYEIQKNAYNEQRNSYQRERNGAGRNNDDNGFYTKLQTWDTAAAFLQKLGSCKTNDESGKVNKIFDDEGEAFGHKKYCDPCSEFKVNCQNGNCGSSANGNTCTNNKITENHINYSTEDIGMLVSDNDKNVFDGDLSVCNGKDIFNGIKKEEWTCGKVCGYNVCKPKKVNGKTFEGITNGEKQIIFIRALFKIWLEYFLEDYNKIIHKISHCTKSENKSTCIRGCNDKCNCVKAWITKKKEEWEKIKNHYLQKKHENGDNDIKSLIKNFLQELDPQTEVLKAIGSSQTLENYEDSKECNGADNLQNGQKRDIIDCLLENLGNEATSCQTNHKPRGSEQCTTPPSTHDTDTPDHPDTYPDDTIDTKPGFCKDEEKVVDTPPKEPCEIVDEVLKQNPNEKGGIDNCNPKRKESNGTYAEWNCKNKTKSGGEGACMPPRRQKLCIYNLTESNQTSTKEKLREAFIKCAAKEVYWLWKKYKDDKEEEKKNGPLSSPEPHEELMKGKIPDDFKRIMYYTYGDYRDLCLGKDIGNDVDNVIKNIKKVFENSKQNGDTPITAQDWWNHNGPHIWEGMVCGLSHHIKYGNQDELRKKLTDNNKYSTVSSKVEDFASRPQCLRWFVEWGDEYCHKRRELEKNVKQSCKEINAGNKDTYCRSTCAEACKEYNAYVTKKKEQYESQKKKFDADKNQKKTVYNNISSDDVSEYLKKKCFFGTCDCMDKVKNNNYWENPYETLDDSELKNKCEGKPEVRPRKVTEDKDPEPSDDGPCDIVKELLKGMDGTTAIDNCNPKRGEFKWECDPSKIENGEEGACIPPRRQELCLYNLQKLSNETSAGLRKAFIQCAAIETYFLWKKYKEDRKKEKKYGGGTSPDEVVQIQLERGRIPEDFKRQMFYTFGDYRDIFLGKDIGNYVNSVNEKINAVLQKIRAQNDGPSIEPDKWWDEYAPAIWEGMLCALEEIGGKKGTLNKKYNYNTVTFGDTSGPNLRIFSSRPQSLRWLTEWGDQFCTERITQLDKLVGECRGCIISTDGKTCNKDGKACTECTTACGAYKTWLQTWQGHYEKQKEKFLRDKRKYEDDLEVKKSENAYKYLETQLDNIKCTIGNTTNYCNCMNKISPTQNDMPESLDYPPIEIEGRCTCVPDECSALSVNDSGFPDAGVFGGGVPSGSCKGFEEHIPKKIETPQYDPTNDILKSTIPVGIALALGSIAFLFMKKKPKSPVDFFSVIDIPKGDYYMPTLKSSNRYIPYGTDKYRGKRYIYLEGDSGTDSGYTDHYSDITSSSESEYEELDINDIYPYQSPKYKTLIEVVLEPSKRETNSGDTIPTSDIPNTPITDEEWNQLKQNFISNMLQSEQKDLPNDYTCGTTPTNTNNTTMSRHNVDNNTHPTMSRHTLDQKPFIMSIHDRNLLSGEEYNYDMSNNSGENNLYSGNNDLYSGSGLIGDNRDSYSGTKDPYSGIDLIIDALSGSNHDIYNELLKRKENELFGTNHTKNTSNSSVAKLTNSDPIMNQINLFDKWLDRHRDMCEKWDKNKVDILNQLKEKWDNDNNSGDTTPSNNKMLNTNVWIEIDMDNPKPINIVDINPDNSSMDKPTMDTMLDDIYYDVNDDDDNNNQPSVDDIPMDHNKVDVDVPKKVHVEMKILNNISNGSLEQQFPISDVWNI
ncbi:erythrocyte membrane protein 1, EMP1 [Plasmodium reichenowi]|uniref:Erythrocyte membrane protein 1, EMP1 n=1 Tax=Plasmodium reichenowi TaxID=5854 RepID=A0A060RRB8_PLARE|nr:erythrocyte membrane protein 1, EMP1 [Plasmodium reichenowi]